MKKTLLFVLSIFFLVSCGTDKKNAMTWRGVEVHESSKDTIIIEPTISEWRDNYPQVVCFTWDDTTPGHEEVAELFNRYNLKTTFFIVSTQYNNWAKRRFFHRQRMKFFDYKTVIEEGHEVGSHTAHHCNLINASLDSVYNECLLSSSQIYERFGYYPTTLSHPTSHYNEAIDSIIHLHYLDSRYSTAKDFDSTISFMHIRTEYNFPYYKASLDSFAISNKKQYIYGGHELDGWGYEPIASNTLDSLLSYLTGKYLNQFWITTFENLTMYKYLYDNVSIINEKGETIINLDKVKQIMERFTHPDAVITLCYPNINLDVSSPGLVNYWFEGGNTYVNIDLRKNNVLYICRAHYCK